MSHLVKIKLIIDIDQLEALMEVVAGQATINGVSILSQGDKYRVRQKTTTPKPELPKTKTSKPEPVNPIVPEAPMASEPLEEPESPKATVVKPVLSKQENNAVELPMTSHFKFAGNEWVFKMEATFEITDLFANDATQMDKNILGCKINLLHPFFKMYGEPTRQTIEIVKALSIANFISTIDGRGSVSKLLAEFHDLLNN